MSETAYILRKETDADVVRRALMKLALNPEQTAAAAEAIKSLDRLMEAHESQTRSVEEALLQLDGATTAWVWRSVQGAKQALRGARQSV